MSTDPYAKLGVAKGASDDEIRAAYRRLAKAHHPDLNPGNQEAERRFKEISSAYAIVGDPDKRKRYDVGEIDETGAEQPERKFYRHYAEASPESRYERAGNTQGFEDLGNIFADLFGREHVEQGEAGARHFRARGRDVRYHLAIDFIEAVNGVKKRLNLPDGRSLDVAVPAGIDDGQQVRLKGMGEPGISGGVAGDALVEITVRPHPRFRRDATVIRSVLPVTLKEAIVGGAVRVDTVTGPVDLKIPRGSNSGSVLRLRGRGVPDASTGQRGDHLVELRVVLPGHRDAELERLIVDWEALHPYDPRKAGGDSA